MVSSLYIRQSVDSKLWHEYIQYIYFKWKYIAFSITIKSEAWRELSKLTIIILIIIITIILIMMMLQLIIIILTIVIKIIIIIIITITIIIIIIITITIIIIITITIIIIIIITIPIMIQLVYFKRVHWPFVVNCIFYFLKRINEMK